MHLELYDRIRARIAAEGFTAETETRISLFLLATKGVNLPFLSLASMGPASSLVWQAANAQLFREGEAMATLMRVTQWSLLPQVYMESARLTAPLYAESLATGLHGGPMNPERYSLEAMAFGHALLSTVRLTPIIPGGDIALSPYAVALTRIEQENGRLIQTQIRLLKDGFGDIALDAREEVIARKARIVDTAFAAFLNTLADG